MNWFSSLATEIRGLDYGDAILAGRKIRQMIKALEEVQQFDTIDASANIKEFLLLARTTLTDMVRSVNVTELVLGDINTISDLSFAWEIMRDFVPDMHDAIRADPQSVSLLRALFLKLTSVLDVPLVRISQAGSEDTLSVAEYYSGELVAFLRTVMEVIPVIVFSILNGIIVLQSKGMKPIPIKIELAELRNLAQLDQRHELARQTHQISVFTEGILAMEKTLLGVIRVDPRQILNDGIRKHLVDQISRALHACLVFDTKGGRGRDPKANLEAQLSLLRDVLDGFKRSFEYAQDYIGIYGLRMWQEEVREVEFICCKDCPDHDHSLAVYPHLQLQHRAGGEQVLETAHLAGRVQVPVACHSAAATAEPAAG
jgi:WASH complex subunit strumpellin